MEKIRWGILGTGRIARSFSEAINGCDDAEAYAAASRSEKKAEAFAKDFGYKKYYGSYEQLAADPDIDIIYIATPMSSHYDDVMMCLRRDKPVLCEKSVSVNARQLDDMITLAHEKKLFFMEAMWMKCRPAFLKARELVRSGKIGSVTCVKADFCNDVPYDENDRLFRPDCGGGALLDLGVYVITFAADFLGYYPREIISGARIGAGGVDFGNSVMLKYDGAAYAELSTGFDFTCRNNATVYGTEGSVRFGDYFFCTNEISLCDKYGNVTEKFTFKNEINGYEYELREAQRCLREGLAESPLVPHSETAAVMDIMDECRRSWGLRYPFE